MPDHQPTLPTDDVVAKLRAMGDELVIAPPDSATVTAVLSRIDREPAGVRSGKRHRNITDTMAGWLRLRWRVVVGVVVAGLIVLLGATPVGAKVREWLGFGAVVVQQDAARSATAPSVAATEGSAIPIEEVGDAVSFPVGRPAVLPAPDSVVISTDHRLVTMAWSGGDLPGAADEVRLDQVSGSLNPYFFKKYYPDVDFVRVNGIESIWLHEAHPVVVLDPDGNERSESARLSGPALIWQNRDVTLRLEGIAEVASARAVAESLAY